MKKFISRTIEYHCQGSETLSSFSTGNNFSGKFFRDQSSDVSKVMSTNQQNNNVEKIVDVEKTVQWAGGSFDMTSVCVQTAIEMNVSDVSAFHGFSHVVFEQPSVGLQDFSCFFVEWIFSVWFLQINSLSHRSLNENEVTHKEKILKSINDRVDGQHRLPVFAQDVQANVPFKVDVWMVNFRLALDLGGLMRIVRTNLEEKSLNWKILNVCTGCCHLKVKREATAFVETLIGTDDQLEV